MEQLNEHHISIIGFNHVSQNTLVSLLSYYIDKYTVDDEHSLSERFQKLLVQLRNSHEKEFEKLDLFKFQQVSSIFFTDASKTDLKHNIKIDSLDITTLVDILENINSFPTCKSKHKQGFTCKGGKNHRKCCARCKGKHPCFKCKNERCNKKCCITKVPSVCDHACSLDCSETKTLCVENSTVCCKDCGYCLNCSRAMAICINYHIRIALTIIVAIRNLCAHNESSNVWNELDSGTFSSTDFPGCIAWDDLWSRGEKSLMIILNHLKNQSAIKIEGYNANVCKLNRFGTLTKGDMLASYHNELHVEYNRIMTFQHLTQTLTLKFDVVVSNDVPRLLLKLNGKLMDSVCFAVSELVKRRIGTKNDSAIKVLRKLCKLDRAVRDQSVLDVEVKLTPNTMDAKREIYQYEDSASAPSTDFWDATKQEIVEHLADQGIDAEIELQGWNLGSIIINLLVVKSIDEVWKPEEIDKVLSTIRKIISNNMESMDIDVKLLNPKGVGQGTVKFEFKIKLFKINRDLESLLDQLEMEARQVAGKFIDFHLLDMKSERINSAHSVRDYVSSKSEEEISQIPRYDHFGYDEEFVTKLPDRLKCCICSYALKNPHQIKTCGHLVCLGCIKSWKKLQKKLVCPLDRTCIENEGDIFADKNIEREINNLKVKCGNRECNWSGELLYLEEHRQSCNGEPKTIDDPELTETTEQVICEPREGINQVFYQHATEEVRIMVDDNERSEEEQRMCDPLCLLYLLRSYYGIMAVVNIIICILAYDAVYRQCLELDLLSVTLTLLTTLGMLVNHFCLLLYNLKYKYIVYLECCGRKEKIFVFVVPALSLLLMVSLAVTGHINCRVIVGILHFYLVHGSILLMVNLQNRLSLAAVAERMGYRSMC